MDDTADGDMEETGGSVVSKEGSLGGLVNGPSSGKFGTDRVNGVLLNSITICDGRWSIEGDDEESSNNRESATAESVIFG